MIKKLDNKAVTLKAIRLLCIAHKEKKDQTIDLLNSERQWIENLLYRLPNDLFLVVRILNTIEDEYYIIRNNQVFITDDFYLYYTLTDFNVVSITV